MITISHSYFASLKKKKKSPSSRWVEQDTNTIYCWQGDWLAHLNRLSCIRIHTEGFWFTHSMCARSAMLLLSAELTNVLFLLLDFQSLSPNTMANTLH